MPLTFDPVSGRPQLKISVPITNDMTQISFTMDPARQKWEDYIESVLISANSPSGGAASAALSEYIKSKKWEIGESIGSGSSARVFRILNTDLVIKVMKRCEKMASWEKDKGEDLAVGLQHKNIVAPRNILYYGNNEVHENGRLGDRIIAIIEPEFHGITLREYLDTHQLSLLETLKIGSQICNGLEYLHEHNIIHEDLSPHNILISAEKLAAVIDFGISRRRNSWPHPQSPRGTVAYASPQRQYEHRAPYRASDDAHSLGKLLYRIYYGCLPEEEMQRLKSERGENHFLKIVQHLSDPAEEKRLSIKQAKIVIDLLIHLISMRPSEKPTTTLPAIPKKKPVSMTPGRRIISS